MHRCMTSDAKHPSSNSSLHRGQITSPRAHPARKASSAAPKHSSAEYGAFLSLNNALARSKSESATNGLFSTLYSLHFATHGKVAFANTFWDAIVGKLHHLPFSCTATDLSAQFSRGFTAASQGNPKTASKARSRTTNYTCARHFPDYTKATVVPLEFNISLLASRTCMVVAIAFKPSSFAKADNK